MARPKRTTPVVEQSKDVSAEANASVTATETTEVVTDANAAGTETATTEVVTDANSAGTETATTEVVTDASAAGTATETTEVVTDANAAGTETATTEVVTDASAAGTASEDIAKDEITDFSAEAEGLMKSQYIKEIWRCPVKGYWFTKSDLASEHGKKVGKKPEHYTL